MRVTIIYVQVATLYQIALSKLFQTVTHDIGRWKRESNNNSSLNDICSKHPNLSFCNNWAKKEQFPHLLGNIFQGTFGIGNADTNVVQFTPEGTSGDQNDGKLTEQKLEGYSDSNTAGGMKRSRSGFLSLGGLGTFDVSRSDEKGAGLTELSDSISSLIFPYALLPRLNKLVDQEAPVKREFDDIDLTKSSSEVNKDYGRVPVESERMEELEEIDKWKPESFLKTSDEVLTGFKREPTDSTIPPSPIDQIKQTLYLLGRNNPTEDSDENEKSSSAESIMKDKKARAFHSRNYPLSTQTAHGRLSNNELRPEEIDVLCKKFAPIAAQHCYGPKIEARFAQQCRGYTADCITAKQNTHSLGAIANAFSSNVGVTYNNWGVNGIPYYGINEEGSTDGGHNGKIDFGSWGGGYSDGVDVRDYFSQKTESGGNWYQGLYGYKTGWSVPIATKYGIEGGGGTQVHVPLKEGELGKSVGYTTGYHVGPYVGVSDGAGVDWYNGVVSSRKAFASPIIGVSGSSGSSFAFPSVSTLLKGFGLSTENLSNLQSFV